MPSPSPQQYSASSSAWGLRGVAQWLQPQPLPQDKRPGPPLDDVDEAWGCESALPYLLQDQQDGGAADEPSSGDEPAPPLR